MPFGQLVVGPPGSGKTTYCAGLQQFFDLTGRRAAFINLDPANDPGSYTAAADIRDLVSLDAVQAELGLGPNGGLIYCIEYLEANLDWLREAVAPLAAAGAYLVFDCPGQAELTTVHGGLKWVIKELTDALHVRLAAVQLIDAHLCADPGKYLAATLCALSTMLHLELPQVNALSKFDLAEQYGQLAFRPEFYLRARGLDRLAAAAGAGLPPRFARLTAALCEVVEDFGLVGFVPLAIEDRESVANVVALTDKANGFAFAGLAAAGEGGPRPAPELQYSAGLVGDAEDLWERMAERYGVGRGAAGRAAGREGGGGDSGRSDGD